MSAKLEMYMSFADGSSYWHADAEDTPEGRRQLDRLALHLLAKKNVVAVSVQPVAGRTGGYVRAERGRI